MYNLVFLLLLLAIFPLISSCSTIVAGRSQEVTFTSEPKGTEVLVAGKSYGTTPITVNLDRKSGQVITFQKEGYNSQTRSLETSVNPWFFGNIVLGGFIGSTTDAITGSMHEYKPNSYYVTLTKDASSTSDSVGKTNFAEIKEYIVINYNSLSQEISQGKGNNLEALIIRMRLRMGKSEFINRLKVLLGKFKDSPDFADEVLKLYEK